MIRLDKRRIQVWVSDDEYYGMSRVTYWNGECWESSLWVHDGRCSAFFPFGETSMREILRDNHYTELTTRSGT